jgi:hypothetical protein
MEIDPDNVPEKDNVSGWKIVDPNSASARRAMHGDRATRKTSGDETSRLYNISRSQQLHLN